MKKAKKYLPLMISLGVFMSLFILFNISSNPPKIESQLSPKHSSYFDEFGWPTKYSSEYISRNGNLVNVRINEKHGVSEPHLISNPVKPGSFAVVANDFSAEGYASIFITENEGLNWKHSKIPLSIIPSSDIYYSDPWADYGSNGEIAFVTVALRSTEYSRNVVFNISRDNGNTWLDYPITLKTFESQDVIFDKPKVRFDKNNNIYVVWLEEKGDEALVSLCISKDGGKSFSDIKTIAEGEIDFTDIIFDENNAYLLYSGENNIKLTSSIDLGDTWSSPVDIAEYTPYKNALDYQFVIKADGEKGVRVNSDPQAVISNGKLFIAFAGGSSEGDYSEVYTIYGDLSKMDFTEPRPVDPNSAADKFLPAVSLDESGVIHILYYSSQNDPENLLTEAFLASTIDFGNTFSYKNLSTERFNPHNIVVDGSYMGDYISLAAGKNKLMAVWTDGRSGNMDLMAGIMPVNF